MTEEIIIMRTSDKVCQDCGKPTILEKFEDILQGLFCIECIDYCPCCQRIKPKWYLECHGGYCVLCAAGSGFVCNCEIFEDGWD
jgi:hypothetical protein